MSVIVAIRVLIVLGIVNATLMLVMVLSCRCFIGAKPLARITRTSAYKKFARYHCWLWWPLWISVATHAVLAFRYLGWPG
jgi:hypothetical protein